MWIGMETLEPEDRVDLAQIRWWDANAGQYLTDHGDTLGPTDFVWGPEGTREEEIGALGDIDGLRSARVLEIGAGAAQCSRFLASKGVHVVASDISPGMLREGRRLNEETGVHVPLLAADASRLPFPDGAFDVVFTSFGALPFIADLRTVFGEVARVLRDGGVLAYSAPHPIRWMFPDSPRAADMTVATGYFAREPYVERDDRGRLLYAEFPHTLADHAGSLAAAGFAIEGIWEPEWPDGRKLVWGGWGPERSAWIPGTIIVRAGLYRRRNRARQTQCAASRQE